MPCFLQRLFLSRSVHEEQDILQISFRNFLSRMHAMQRICLQSALVIQLAFDKKEAAYWSTNALASEVAGKHATATCLILIDLDLCRIGGEKHQGNLLLDGA